MAIRQIRAGRRPLVEDVNTYVGQKGVVFYDEDTGTLRLSDGVTPGGINNVLPVASSTEVGGIKLGPGVLLNSEDQIIIDSTGLDFNFGDFQATSDLGQDGSSMAAILSSLNDNQDIIIQSNGTGSISIVGEFNVFPTDGPLSTRDPVFEVRNDGQITIRVPIADPNAGAVEIVGSATGATQTPVNTSVMLHVTGNNDDNARIYMDAIGGYGGFVARRYNGTALLPTGVLENDEIGRFVANGRLATGWAQQGVGRLSFYANQNQATNAQGGRAEFWITPNNSAGTNQVKTMSMTANNVIMHGSASVVGNLSVGNISATGITGTLSNGNSNVAIAANGNVSVSATGTANVLVVTATGANIAGTANVSGNANVGNLGAGTIIATTANIGNINVGTGGTVSTPRVIINDGGIRTVSGGTALTVDFATDSIIHWTAPSGTATITLSNYTAGARVKVIIRVGATSRDINYGVAGVDNSSTGATAFNGSGGGSVDISDSAFFLDYTCIDNTAANCYVQVSTVYEI